MFSVLQSSGLAANAKRSRERSENLKSTADTIADKVNNGNCQYQTQILRTFMASNEYPLFYCHSLNEQIFHFYKFIIEIQCREFYIVILFKEIYILLLKI